MVVVTSRFVLVISGCNRQKRHQTIWIFEKKKINTLVLRSFCTGTSSQRRCMLRWSILILFVGLRSSPFERGYQDKKKQTFVPSLWPCGAGLTNLMQASWKTAGANVSLCTMEREESRSNKPREGFVRIDFLAELCKQGPCVSVVRNVCWCTSTEFEQLQRTIAPAFVCERIKRPKVSCLWKRWIAFVTEKRVIQLLWHKILRLRSAKKILVY